MSKLTNTLKWNTADRVATQILYAVTGVVLANLLTKEDFGLVGALLVFQAFGNLFVDSGFGSALLQRKEPSQADYTTIFWFNMAVATVIYAILFLCAPLIADIFQGDRRLIPLSRVMFLSFVLNGTAMVQTTRLMKNMDVKQIAVANSLALLLSGGLGVGLAFAGAGAWALVWQTVSMSGIKSAWLWIKGRWHPTGKPQAESLRKMWRVGISVFSSSALNTFFLYIYSFVIGAFYSLTSLGVYTQADKWSKMGSASISQILTASFVPLLSKFQDDGDAFRSLMSRVNRFCALLAFPVLCGLAAVGAPLFHTLFGTKWDSAIPLFQILSVRGVFIVLVSLYSNYLLALGYGKRLFSVEVVKDILTVIALLCTVWFGSVPMLVWGQLAASFATWATVLVMVCRGTGMNLVRMLLDILPSLLKTIVMAAGTLIVVYILETPWVQLTAGIVTGVVIYLALNAGTLGRGDWKIS